MASPNENGPRRTIAVNGTEIEVLAKELTFEELVALAEPGHTDPAPNYTITYGRRQHPGMQALLPGQTVELKMGMVFDVYLANRS